MFSGVDTPAVRMTLLGARNPRASAQFVRDLDSVVMSEIFEYASSLVPVVKGQEPFAGLPHLQAYRLMHAWQLVELGEVQRAQK